MKGGTFRSTQWDPFLLTAQIIAMQSLLYVSLGIVMCFMEMIVGDGTNHTLNHLFQYHEIHVSDIEGRLVICAFIVNSLIGSFALWFIVKRTKMCLDFSCTFHFLHLVVCWWYNASFPSNFSWWFLNAICVALMCVGGEFLCLKTELKEIPVGYAALNQKADV
ncbi:unnamed protein product [Hermetia illucens]|uniref:Protein SYS1 homolog n=1 Tax=Hermetia illucens TaxID=343691 RepID=A0A7R8Z265_HERIL|nr:protein SYS1 homolog [Hermetia illucens]CAD7092673.1 unnamed protein product [Hermetia illucens]